MHSSPCMSPDLSPHEPGAMYGVDGGQFVIPAGYAISNSLGSSLVEDADLGAGDNSKFHRVYGNAAFESHPTAMPGAVKTDSLGPQARIADQHISKTRIKTYSEQEPATGNDHHHDEHYKLVSPSGDADRSSLTMIQPFGAASGHVNASMLTTNKLGNPVAAWELEIKQMRASGMWDEAICMPAPSSGALVSSSQNLVRCYLKRVKGFFGKTSAFQMHLTNGDVFLLAARRRKKSKVSSYIISKELEDLTRESDNCVAKLKANFVGTEYMLWGKSSDKHIKKGYASQELCIDYSPAALASTGGPRTMSAALPLPESRWRPSSPDGDDGLGQCLEQAKLRELSPALERKLALLCTKPPEYEEAVKGYTLDFVDRQVLPSVKNFQLVTWDHQTGSKGKLILQFGKMEDDLYMLDFAYPLTITLAFAIALAAIDTKLCYTMG